MEYKNIISFLALILVLSSCYHAKITTDKMPSKEIIEEPWAHSFVYGLVPPDVVEVGKECENGVAMVETKISFLNGLVSALTLNLYTPMHITVTCAVGPTVSFDGEVIISKSWGKEDIINAFKEASERAAETGEVIFVKLL